MNINDIIERMKEEIADYIDGNLDQSSTMLIDQSDLGNIAEIFQEAMSEIDTYLQEEFNELYAETIEKHQDDTVMLSEMYNNWTDSLCKDGTIPAMVYNNLEGYNNENE